MPSGYGHIQFGNYQYLPGITPGTSQLPLQQQEKPSQSKGKHCSSNDNYYNLKPNLFNICSNLCSCRHSSFNSPLNLRPHKVSLCSNKANICSSHKASLCSRKASLCSSMSYMHIRNVKLFKTKVNPCSSRFKILISRVNRFKILTSKVNKFNNLLIHMPISDRWQASIKSTQD